MNVSTLPTLGIPSMITKRLSPMRFSPNSTPPDTAKPDDSPQAIYEAESPDELALVHAARAYNVTLVKRTPRSAIVTLPDKSTIAFEILHVSRYSFRCRFHALIVIYILILLLFSLQIFPFDSNRKCMSVIVKHPDTGDIVLYCKGADSTILSTLSASDEDSTTTAKLRSQLHSYARQGLRTLAMARRSLSPQEYETWHAKHLEAELSTESRERRLRDSYAALEKHFTLLGATGIEDKLQPGVPQAIEDLVAAGIVIWVLTGWFRFFFLNTIIK